jgi:protein XagA
VLFALGAKNLIAAGRRLGRSRGCAGAIALIVAAPAAALAGAWTLPQGSGLLIETLYGWTGYGLPFGGTPAVPQTKVEAQTYFEYGFTDRLTIFGQFSLEHYALGAPTSDVYNGLDYSSVGLRAKLWSTGEWVFSGEAIGYAPGARDSTQPAQAGNTGGAGEARLLAGTNFTLWSTPGFVDAQIGYRLRTAGPPDEWHGDLTIGLKFTPRIMLMLQDFTTVSAASTNPGFPAWRSSVVEASVVYALDDKWSVQFGLFASVWAVKTNTQRGAALSVWRRF